VLKQIVNFTEKEYELYYNLPLFLLLAFSHLCYLLLCTLRMLLLFCSPDGTLCVSALSGCCRTPILFFPDLCQYFLINASSIYTICVIFSLYNLYDNVIVNQQFFVLEFFCFAHVFMVLHFLTSHSISSL